MFSEALPENMSVDEAADYVRLSKVTLNRMRFTGSGPLYVQTQARGRVIYRRCDMDDWLLQHTRRSTSDVGCKAKEIPSFANAPVPVS